MLDTVLGTRALVDAGGVILTLHQSGSKTEEVFIGMPKRGYSIVYI